MSENNDSSRSERAGEQTTEPRERAHRNASNVGFTRSEWENLPSDPDVKQDFGYRVAAWETIETATDSSQVIFMPQNEELLRDDTFIVAEEEALCDLGRYY